MAWYDDLNNGFPLGGQVQPGSIEALRATMAAQKPKEQPKKKKDFWTDQISTGGGIGGALGGAALGASLGSIVPGIGTVIGGLAGGVLGGAFGSGGGELAENVITGDPLLQNVGQEALLGGVFAAPPLRALRGLGAAGKVGLGIGKDAAEQTAKGAFEKAFVGGKGLGGDTSRNVAERASQSLRSGAWGIKSGAKLSGNVVSPQRAQELQKFVNTIGVPKTANADQVLEKAFTYRNQTGEAIGSAIKNSTLKSSDISALNKSLTTRLGRIIGVDSANNTVAKDVLSQIKSAKSPAELWDIRKQLDSTLINFSRNPQSVVPGGEQIAKAARAEINTVLSRLAPEIKSLNKSYSNVADIIELTAGAAKSPVGVPLPGVLRSVGGEATQGVKAFGANALDGAAGIAGKLGGGGLPKNSIGGLIPNTIRQAGGRAIVGGSQPPLDEALMQQSENQYLGSPGFGQQGQVDTSQYMGSQPQQPEQSMSQNPYPQENLLYDLQRDPANGDKYIARYKALQEIFASGSGQPEYSSTIAGNLSDFQSSLTELDNLRGSISGGAGTTDPILGRLRALNPYDTEQQTLQAAIDKTRQIVGKALEGGVLRKEDEEKYKKILPTTADTKEVALQKIDAIQQQIASKMQNYQYLVGTGGGASLQDALLQQSQGAY